MTVVLAVGARPSGHASAATLVSSTTSAPRARGDAGSPLIAKTGSPSRRAGASSATSSGVRPLFDTARKASPRASMPMSPCRPSAACRKSAGVPVEASVAAILRQTMPDLPSPLTTTFPSHPRSRSTARENSSPSRSASARTAAISTSSTRRATARSTAIRSLPPADGCMRRSPMLSPCSHGSPRCGPRRRSREPSRRVPRSARAATRWPRRRATARDPRGLP